MVDYTAFWETLEKKVYSQYILIERFNVSQRIINYIKHGKNISLKSLNDLCGILDCDFKDIISYVPGPTDNDYSEVKKRIIKDNLLEENKDKKDMRKNINKVQS